MPRCATYEARAILFGLGPVRGCDGREVTESATPRPVNMVRCPRVTLGVQGSQMFGASVSNKAQTSPTSRGSSHSRCLQGGSGGWQDPPWILCGCLTIWGEHTQDGGLGGAEDGVVKGSQATRRTTSTPGQLGQDARDDVRGRALGVQQWRHIGNLCLRKRTVATSPRGTARRTSTAYGVRSNAYLCRFDVLIEGRGFDGASIEASRKKSSRY